MARLISPQCKLCRRQGEKLFLKGDRCSGSKCSLVKRNYPPGMHGNKSHPKNSGYSVQLREKQKAKRTYGVLEKQFRNYYLKASKKVGNSAEYMLKFLECRLDNVIYRAGLANSRKLARQLVSHKHFLVNGKNCNIPSYQVSVGEKIQIKKNCLNKKYWQDLIKTLKPQEINSWVDLNTKEMIITIKSEPDTTTIKKSIAINLIVEYYSR